MSGSGGDIIVKFAFPYCSCIALEDIISVIVARFAFLYCSSLPLFIAVNVSSVQLCGSRR